MLLVPAVFMVVFEVAAQAPVKKYDVKSGIVTYELISKVGKLEMKLKSIVYFDDYGMKECKETYSNDQLSQSYFSDGKEIYAVKHNKKMAYKRGTANRGTELRVEWSEFGTEKDRQTGKIKRLPAMKVAGKDCEMIASDDGKGNITRYGGWKKILFYMNTGSSGSETTIWALHVDENAKVSSEKFQVPAGYKIE